jgi:hypothetical protein
MTITVITWTVVHFDQCKLERNNDRIPKSRSAETAITNLKFLWIKQSRKNLPNCYTGKEVGQRN